MKGINKTRVRIKGRKNEDLRRIRQKMKVKDEGKKIYKWKTTNKRTESLN